MGSSNDAASGHADDERTLFRRRERVRPIPTPSMLTTDKPIADGSLLRAIAEILMDGLITTDAHGIIDSFNPAAEAMLGYTSNEVIGKNIKMLMPEPQHSAHDGYMRSYRDSGHETIIGAGGRDMTARRKDGTTFPIKLGVSEMEMRGRQVFVGIIRDMTVHSKAERQAALLASIVTSSDDAIISKTLNSIITSWNLAAERMFGFTAAQAIGQHIGIIIPLDRLSEEPELMAHIRQGRPVEHFETLRQGKDGNLIDVSITDSPILNAAGKVVGASKIIRDISAQKRAEAELERTMQAVKRSNQELDDFAYIASHDLKEPLRGLANNAMFLEEDFADKLDEGGTKRLRRMTFLCHRMERLVDDLLYFSRLGRQQLAVRRCDLNAVVEDVRSTMEASGADANVTISVSGVLPTIICDELRITEVFRNLISNGIKYNSNAHKRIEIGCTHRFDEPDHAERVFYVRDNGIGIAPEFNEVIFRIFKRLNQEDDAVKGTGVGLTFVRKIIERHNGRIWVESSLGEGSTFYFTLNGFSESTAHE